MGKRAEGAAATTAMAVLLAANGGYALLRLWDVIVPPSSPAPAAAMVAWSTHIAMFWRLSIAGYAAGMLAPLVNLAARSDLMRTLAVFEAALLGVAALVIVQGLAFP